MLICIRHPDSGELAPDRLSFTFSECPFRRKVAYMNRMIQSESRKLTGKSADTGDDADAQTPLIRISRGDRIFARLSPEAGSVFHYWVPLGSKAEITLVISPLNSLARDRKSSFEMISPAQGLRNIRHTDIRTGKLRLIYIEPESLSFRNFMDEIREIIGEVPVHCLLVDNAHCVSEWSSEFRPSYRRIPEVAARLREAHPKMTMLAFTAEPGRMIRKDIERFFQASAEEPEPVRDFYRKNLSFQGLTVRGQAEKAAAYEKIFTHDVPAIWGREGLTPPEDFPPYRNPYELSPDAAPADMLSVTTHAENTAAPCVRVWTSLGGSPARWLYEAVRTAENGRRVHCVRIADLPEESCEDDMAARTTRIPACADGDCPFGREEPCDYGSQHRLLVNQTPDVVESALQTLQTLDYLLSSFEAGDTPVQIDLTSVNPGETELALHRLSMIGVVEAFMADRSYGHRVFKAYGFINAVESTAALNRLCDYLRDNDLSVTRKYMELDAGSLKGPKGEIARFRETYGPAIAERLAEEIEAGNILNAGKYRKMFEQVADYLPLLLCHVHREKQEAARNRLWNLKTFMRFSNCRYARLLQTVEAVEEEWKCGRCDCCAPDLNFAAEPVPPVRPGPLESRLSGWLENPEALFDAEETDRFVSEFADFFYNVEMRSAHALEESPRNLKALYLAREFARDPLRPSAEVALMRIARRDLPLLRLLRLYETSRAGMLVRRLTFDLLDDEFGDLNCPQGEKWLYEQAGKLHLEEERRQLLEGRLALNLLARLNISEMNEKLTRLSKESEGGPAVKS